jgi:hypothetical protein
MLEFKKTHGLEGSITSSFAVVPDGSIMVVTRLIDNKGFRLVFKLDGTIGALGTKVNQVCEMSNDDFKEFSLIQFAKEDHAI